MCINGHVQSGKDILLNHYQHNSVNVLSNGIKYRQKLQGYSMKMKGVYMVRGDVTPGT